jgi:hypothetical protein
VRADKFDFGVVDITASLLQSYCLKRRAPQESRSLNEVILEIKKLFGVGPRKPFDITNERVIDGGFFCLRTAFLTLKLSL